MDDEVISRTLYEVLGDDNEDAFQEAYAILCERHQVTLPEVRRIALEVKRKAVTSWMSERRVLRSLEAPLNKTANGNFSLADRLEGQELVGFDDLGDDPPAIGRRKGKSGWVGCRLDSEVISWLNARYPTVPYRQAIRAALGIKPSHRRAWLPHEDAAIRRLYPVGGYASVKKAIDRDQPQIAKRARRLGVRYTGDFSTLGFLRSKEVAAALRVSVSMVSRLVRLRKLTPHRTKNGKYNLFSPEDIERLRCSGW